MNRAELIEKIAIQSGLTKPIVTRVLTKFSQLVIAEVARGRRVSLYGFGLFSAKQRAKKMGRNPQTGEQMVLPARRAGWFAFAKTVKKFIASGTKN